MPPLGIGMQLLGQQQPQSYGQKPGIQQPPEASFGQSAQNLPRQLQQLPRQQHQLQLQQQKQQLPRQQPQQQQQWHNSYGNIRAMDGRNGSHVAMVPSPQMFNYNHDYGYVPTGAESSGWTGYASCQPMDASKPFAFGWSPTD
ncbi:transcriptional activator MN1 [Drosophila tropicalis]|uniref:transcriptional activator MN1 n=1 Tax=Drosophila tropicalis TaxID=46794 RepID=UPI0035AB9F5B